MKTEPSELPARSSAKRSRLWLFIPVGLIVLVVLVSFPWWRGRLVDADTRRVEAILEQARRQERNLTGGNTLTRLLDSLPGIFGILGNRINAGAYKGTHEFAEEAVKLGTNAIPPLIVALRGDSSTTAREVAALALGDLRAASALAALTNAVLRDTASNVRVLAAQALNDLDDRAALPALRHAMRSDADSEGRSAMIHSFARLGGREVLPELAALAGTETNWSARAALARVFGGWGEQSVVPTLAAWVKEHGVPVPPAAPVGRAAFGGQADRYDFIAVIDALGEIGGPDAYDVLTAAWETETDKDVREVICRSFGNVGDARAQPLLLAALEEITDVRAAAARALGTLGDTNAAPALLELLEDASQEVRRETILGLGQLGAATATPRLAELLRTEREDNLRNALCQALGQIGDPAAVPLILEALPNLGESHDEALWALGHLGDPSAIPALTAALTHKVRENRFAAAFALVEIGGPVAADALAGALTDEDDFARLGKACALTLLGRTNALAEIRAGLRAKEPWRRFGSILALGAHSAPIDAAWWEPALADADPVLRRFAVEAAAGRLTGGLITLLAETDSDHRMWAARALMLRRDPAALPALERAARGSNASSREAARLAVALIRRAPAAVP